MNGKYASPGTFAKDTMPQQADWALQMSVALKLELINVFEDDNRLHFIEHTKGVKGS